MWLIDTSTYQLKSFVGTRIPKYAILSHRWRNNEITFGEIQDENYMQTVGCASTGWKKIKNFCDLANQRNIQYAWVDSCCIDKSSSAELSESINSMFQWYKNAQVCIAYLSDVTNWDEFGISDWFSRGWTLQELLAPTSVEFMKKDWSFLCTRKEKAETISQRTKIPLPVVYNPQEYPVTNCSIAQRLSWASNRKTTRAEDAVYCLLGIFGVNMPLLYGEGEANAFRRLQLEIIGSSDDDSVFAWSAQPVGEFAFTRTATRPDPVLAPHIRSFSFASRVRRSDIPRHRVAYSMTNRGLRVALTLHEVRSKDRKDGSKPYPDRCLAPLDCCLYGTRLCLVLEKTVFPEETYARRGICLAPSPLDQGVAKEIIIASKPVAPRNPPGLSRKQLLKHKYELAIGKIKVELSSGDMISGYRAGGSITVENTPLGDILEFLAKDFKAFLSVMQYGEGREYVRIVNNWPFPMDLKWEYAQLCEEVEDYIEGLAND